MRSTLTIDDDLAHRLKERARDEGRSWKEVVNDTLRKGLMRDAPDRAQRPIMEPWDGGALLIDPDTVNTHDLLTAAEGESFR